MEKDYDSRRTTPIQFSHNMAQTEVPVNAPRTNGRRILTESRGTSPETFEPPVINFTPQMTYAERLMLRMHRRKQIPPLTASSDNGKLTKLNEQDKLDSVDNDVKFNEELKMIVQSRPGFHQLHALATANLEIEDLLNMCTMEDLEVTDGNCQISRSNSIDHQSIKYSAESSESVDSEHRTRQIHSDRQQPIDLKVQKGQITADAIIPRKVDHSWTNELVQQPTSATNDELATLDVIKKHLNTIIDTETLQDEYSSEEVNRGVTG